MIIIFTSKDIQKCEKFAKAIDTNFYATRNQKNDKKRELDQVIGKLGEIATFKYGKEVDINFQEPDFKIYEKKDKSWDYDLKSSEINMHVKSQSVEQAKKYGTSWIFQNQDKHIFQEYTDKDYVSFVVVDYVKKIADLKAVVQIKKLHELNLFKKPKLLHLSSKSAVYYDDIKTIPEINLLKRK